MIGRRNECSAEPLIKEQIRKEANQPQQKECNVAAENADADGQKGNPHHASGGSEVAQFLSLIRIFACEKAFPDPHTRIPSVSKNANACKGDLHRA